MTDAPLLIAIENACAVLTLNRPAVLNALSGALRRQLVEALAKLDADPAVRVVILTGAGRAFTAGIDLKEIAASSKSVEDNVAASNVVEAMEKFSKPIIGAINGLAITGGLEIALACDILLAGDSARFADTHVRVGINPGWGLSQRLSRAIGIYRAKELSLSGNFFTAADAASWGLVNRVVPDGELMTAARALAADIAANDPVHVARMKRVMDDGFAMELGAALHMEAGRARQLNADVSAGEVAAGKETAQTRARKTL